MTKLTAESAVEAEAGEKILAFGHSHLSALMRAGRRMTNARQLGETGMHFVRLNHKTCLPNFLVEGGTRDIHPDLKRRLRFILKRDMPKALFLSLLGNEYNTIAMLRHPEPFDFHWPEMDLPADPKSTVIPFDLMKAQLRSMADHSSLLFWRYFASVYDGPMYFVPPPPPIANEDHIRAYPGAFAERVAEYGLSKPELRLKMWMLYCEVLREAIKGSSTTFVELPLEIFDAGFLKSIYWQHDPTHGNEAYGEVILRKMLSLAKVPVATAKAAS
jgi:hypothetical protein